MYGVYYNYVRFSIFSRLYKGRKGKFCSDPVASTCIHNYEKGAATSTKTFPLPGKKCMWPKNNMSFNNTKPSSYSQDEKTE